MLRLRGQSFAALRDRGQGADARLLPARAVPSHETTIPASKASIQTIASLHALVTLRLLDEPSPAMPRASRALLLTLQRVQDVFDEAFRPYRFRVPRAADCLICQARPTPSSVEELDVALDQALARLGDA